MENRIIISITGTFDAYTKGLSTRADAPRRRRCHCGVQFVTSCDPNVTRVNLALARQASVPGQARERPGPWGAGDERDGDVR